MPLQAGNLQTAAVSRAGLCLQQHVVLERSLAAAGAGAGSCTTVTLLCNVADVALHQPTRLVKSASTGPTKGSLVLTPGVLFTQ